jgi:hypothetical protein
VSNEHPAGGPHSRERGATPPSAAGFLEPYGVRVILHPGQLGVEAEPFLKALLEDTAATCAMEGASVVGHLKCLLRAGDRRLRCNLTSTRSGATCRGDGGTPLSLTEGADLDLAVLVYGVPATVVDRIVGDTLRGLLGPVGVSWSKTVSFHAHQGHEGEY